MQQLKMVKAKRVNVASKILTLIFNNLQMLHFRLETIIVVRSACVRELTRRLHVNRTFFNRRQTKFRMQVAGDESARRQPIAH